MHQFTFRLHVVITTGIRFVVNLKNIETMKKSILILSAVFTTFSLMAFGYLNSGNTTTKPNQKVTSNEAKIIPAPIDFFYDVDSRFMSTITKEKLHSATSILDFLPKTQTDQVELYTSVKVIILDDYRQTDRQATGKDDVLTAAQLKLLQSVDYSDNILIRADYQQKNNINGVFGYNYFTPHITIIPEKEAAYIYGKDALINYLKTNSQEKISIVQKGNLKGGKLYFTVTKKGTIKDIKLAATSGYPAIDTKMIELMENNPGMWFPAENEKGEKVEQKLVFSFGTIGC